METLIKCIVCQNWKNTHLMHNDFCCADCFLDHTVMIQKYDDTTITFFQKGHQIYAYADLTTVPFMEIDRFKSHINSTVKQLKEPLTQTVSCICGNELPFNKAIFVSYEGKPISLCDYDCYMALKERVV